MNKSYLISALVAGASAAASDHWAVIVAGSNGFYNYRHQTDTCHAYQLMIKNGIPAENIIHMSYDDVANDPENPFPGQLFNKPTAKGTPGVDVYAGCNIDYKGNSVTPDNLIAVLTGDTSINGPVLKSNENSKVFFYFADHGAPGLVAMPAGGYLYADKLNDAFKTMHAKKMYKEMTVYMEACESGSMFENILSTELGIYAVSASNASTSSWATYCSPNDMVDGKSIGSCLGDLFSVNWMEDSDKAKMNKETLQEQWKTVAAETDKSPVLQWGQLTFTSEPIGDFEGSTEAAEEKKMNFKDHLKKFGHGIKGAIKDITKWNQIKSMDKTQSAVDSRNVKMHYLYNKVQQDASLENINALQVELTLRAQVDTVMEKLFPMHMEAVKNKSYPNPTEFNCLRELINEYEANCHKLDDYSLKWVAAFVSQCEGMKSFPQAKFETINKIKTVCAAETFIL
jgi:legumain